MSTSKGDISILKILTKTILQCIGFYNNREKNDSKVHQKLHNIWLLIGKKKQAYMKRSMGNAARKETEGRKIWYIRVIDKDATAKKYHK